MGAASLSRYADHLSAALRNLPAMLRVKASGLFDAEDYKRVNPECDFGALRCLWHWVRHGYPEGRIPSESPVTNWLLPHVTSGDISLRAAKDVSRAGRGEDLRAASAAAGLDLSELDYLDSYLHCDFEAAARHLEKTSGLFYLRAVHQALRAMPAIDNFRPAYEKILADPACAPERLSAPDMTRLRNIAFAAGAPWAQIARYNRPIAQASPAPAIDPGWEIFSAVAGDNAVSAEAFTSITLEGEAFAKRPAMPDDAILFMPDDALWRAAGENEKLIREAFKLTARRILASGAGAVVLPAPFTRDLSAVDLPPFRVVSYHTYAADRPEMLHYKESSLRGVFFFDAKGYSGASAAGDARFADRPVNRDLVARMRERYQSSDMTKYRPAPSEETQGFDAPEDYVFVPLQVLDDSSQRWQALQSWRLLEIAADYYAGSATKVVAKRHPYDRTPFTRELLARLAGEHKIIVTDEPIQKLLAGAKAVCVANSGVGFEALLYGKPVVSTGRSEYHACTYFCEDKTQVAAALEAIGRADGNPKEEETVRYLSGFFETAAFEVGADGSGRLEGGFGALDRHLRRS
ncbi:hypothetical protein [Hyphococcus luteus]|uniref:Capsular biosynthesis protein n=1 Tax=Hyphococcus luteus TaxID=2058213 RepID=A0A2S7K7T3_9PROT|nr:hypothetical protein [Marinicaulis flavus]PQA88560.1 hypothetical protein CW354_09770 [Marinicaulis flavus]